MSDWALFVILGILCVTKTCHLIMDIQDARRKRRARHD